MMQTANLYKSYHSRTGSVDANQGIDLVIEPGKIIALVGPNGAGKSTLVRQLVGLLKPDRGSITLDGAPFDPANEPQRRRIAYVPQSPWLVNDLTVEEALYLIARLNHFSPVEARERVGSYLDRFQMGGKRAYMTHRLSGGESRILNLGYSFMSAADYFFLDEPTNDLSPGMRRNLWQELFNLRAAGKSVFIVTHNLLDIQQRVDRVVFMSQGRFILDDSPQNLIRSLSHQLRLTITFTKPPGPEAMRALEKAVAETGADKAQVSWTNDAITVVVGSQHLAAIAYSLFSDKRIESIDVHTASLEDVYERVVTDD